MRKIALSLLIVLMLLLTFGCAERQKDETKVMPSGTDYSQELSTATPEGLAKESSIIYQNMLNQNVTVEEGFNQLLALSSEQASSSMLEYKDEFKKQINQTIDYFEQQDDSITGIDFTETDYKDENSASIQRIQKQKSGNKYYFKQDFVKENDVWKIKGDNITNDFTIMKKILFWYI